MDYPFDKYHNHRQYYCKYSYGQKENRRKKMNITALRAKAQSVQVQNTNYIHMVFKDKEQELFYYQTLKQAGSYDCYHKALFCVFGILKDTRSHLNQSYDEKTDCIKVGCLQKGWQTSSKKVVRLAFNLCTNETPSAEAVKRKEEQIEECKTYSVSNIFCCSDARHFWEGIRLRYPEYDE